MAALSAKPAGGPIQFLQILHELIDDVQMLRAMAKSEDGKIRNPHLLLEAVDKTGRTLERAARIGVITRDTTQLDAFLDALTSAVKVEGPDVWGRVAERMRSINQAYGYPL